MNKEFNLDYKVKSRKATVAVDEGVGDLYHLMMMVDQYLIKHGLDSIEFKRSGKRELDTVSYNLIDMGTVAASYLRKGYVVTENGHYLILNTRDVVMISSHRIGMVSCIARYKGTCTDTVKEIDKGLGDKLTELYKERTS